MALGDTYATVEELKSRLSIPLTKIDFDDDLQDALTAASEEIEKHCNRQFNKATSASARDYAVKYPYTADVDDFYSTTGLIIQTDATGDGTFETTWIAGDYELHPLNGIVDGQPGWPYSEVQAVNTQRFPGGWRYRRARLRVTALWGWANVPAPVKTACLIMAARNFQLKDAPLGVAGMSDFGVVRVQDDKIAQSKLSKYVRNKILVG
jgi:hypothetical protein